MIIEQLNDCFLRLSRCLFNSKNEQTCQDHTKKSGCIFFLAYYLDLHHQSVGVHGFRNKKKQAASRLLLIYLEVPVIYKTRVKSLI